MSLYQNLLSLPFFSFYPFYSLLLCGFFLYPATTLFSQEPIPDMTGSMAMPAEKNSGLKINGLIRNDFWYFRMPSNPKRSDLFANNLEARLILEHKRNDWDFYADGRFYFYQGEFQTLYGTSRAVLMRAYMRYFSPIGDFTLGKTYVNFGNSGLFNPFEIDKSIQLADLQYAREGIYALEYYLPWQDLSGLKVYGGFTDAFNYNPMWGVAPGFHLGTFDLGAVWNHSDINKNITGLFFKGDLILGVQGSWGVHLDDKLQYDHSEASAGLDYSFFEGKVITTLLFYYNEMGATDVKKYQVSAGSYLLARYYLFFSLVWTIDEFWSIQANAFMNLIDQSMIILPVISVVVANGLTLVLQMNIPTASGNEEFSRKKSGDIGAMLRVEGKF